VKRYLLGLTLISTLAHGQYKAEEFEAALLEAKYGALLVYNGQTNSFSLKLESQSVQPTERPNFIMVDSILLQVTIMPFHQKLDFANLDYQTQTKYLTSWKAYEKQWVEEQFKARLTENEELIDISNKPFLYWTFEMPKSGNSNSVDRQVYLAAICFDQLLVLNAPVEKDQGEGTVKDKILLIAKTLTLYPNKTQDLEKLYNELKNQ
jgi:hypothetical protein